MSAPAAVRFERILVALDESEEHGRVLQSAAEIAARLEAELSGLFVEDVDLLRLAELPCAREVHYSGREAAPDAAVIRRAMRVQAEAAKRALAGAAERRRLRWSFRVARGNVARELVTAAARTDLMVVGRTRLAHHRRIHVGTTARRVAAEAPAAVLVPGRGNDDGPVVVVYDGSPASARALAAAARIAERGPAIVLATDAAEADGAHAGDIDAAFADHPSVMVRRCRAEALAGTVNAVGPSLLVYGCDCGPELTPPLQRLFDAIEAPILLIRAR